MTWLAWGSMALAIVVLFFARPFLGSDFLMHLTAGRVMWRQGKPNVG